MGDTHYNQRETITKKGKLSKKSTEDKEGIYK